MKKLFYKMFSIFALWLLWVSWLFWIASAQGVTSPDWFWGGIAGGGVAWITTDWALKQDSLITSVKTFVNRVLGLLALIALIILLRGWFQIVTAAWNAAKFKNWFKLY